MLRDCLSQSTRRHAAAKQAETRTFGLVSLHAFVNPSTEPILNLPNLVHLSRAITCPRGKGAEIVESQPFAVIVHFISFDDSSLDNLPSTEVPEISDIRVCDKEAYILGRCPRTAKVLDALNILCHGSRYILVEFDVVWVGLPRDGVEVVANIKRERCGTAEYTRMIDLKYGFVLAVLVQPGFKLAVQRRS